MTVQETIDKAVSWAVAIARDDSHGYDQAMRYGNPDFDCSSLIIAAWEAAGVPVKSCGASFTGDMRAAFKRCGFVEVPLASRRRGDVLLNERYHTAMMVDSYTLVNASINEKGTAIGGKAGDQTGNEITVRSYYNYSRGWDCVLRYVGNKDMSAVNPGLDIPLVKNGSRGQEVVSLQLLLNGKARENLEPDGICGSMTVQAIMRWQSAHGLIVDGECGVKTWHSLLLFK